MEIPIWNAVLTAVIGLVVYFMKSKFEEVDRLEVLLNKTREEVARDHITRAEFHRDMEKLMDRLDAGLLRLEEKIDALNNRAS